MPSLSRAGAETQLVELINGLDPMLFEKTLVILDKNADQLDRVDKKNVDFFQFIRASKLDARIVLKLAKLIRAISPDVIHCTNQFAMFIAWAATKFTNIKPRLIVTLHTTVDISLKSEFYERTLYRWILGRFDCVIFVCFAQAAYWKNKYKEIKNKSVVVYNGVDPEFFDSQSFGDSPCNLSAKLQIKPSEPVIACIASFRPEKAHALLIEAFAQLDGGPHLILAGEGMLRAQVESQVQRLGLDQRTHFLGNITDVRPVLAIADVSVLSSATETFSMAMLESMAMSTPVVATNVGGLGEAVIPEQTGYLVAAGNVAELRLALSDAISNRDNLACLGANARRLVLEKFSTTMMIEKTGAVLRRVLDSDAC